MHSQRRTLNAAAPSIARSFRLGHPCARCKNGTACRVKSASVSIVYRIQSGKCRHWVWRPLGRPLGRGNLSQPRTGPWKNSSARSFQPATLAQLKDFHDTGLVFNIIRGRLKTEPITADVLQETRLGLILQGYGKCHPIAVHKMTAKELVNQMKSQLEAPTKKPRLDCAVQPNADAIAQTKSQEVAVTPSGSASMASSCSPPTHHPA